MKNDSDEITEKFLLKCRRLNRLIRVHFEALKWVICCTDKRQSNSPQPPFHLAKEELRMLGFTTASQLRDRWEKMVASVAYVKESLPITPEVYYRTDLQTKVIEGELVPLPDGTVITGVEFNRNPNHIPLGEFAEEVKIAFSGIEADLQAVGIPIQPLTLSFSVSCESVADLLEYKKVNGIGTEKLLWELKQQKNNCQEMLRSLRRRLLYKHAVKEKQPTNSGREGDAKERKSKAQKLALIASHLKEHPYATSSEIAKSTGIDASDVRRLWKSSKQALREPKREKYSGTKDGGKTDIIDPSAYCKICTEPLAESFSCTICKEVILGECKDCHYTNSHPQDAIP